MKKIILISFIQIILCEDECFGLGCNGNSYINEYGICCDPDYYECNLCTTEYMPVCGYDGITYSNECEALNLGCVPVLYEGPCYEPPPECPDYFIDVYFDCYTMDLDICMYNFDDNFIVEILSCDGDFLGLGSSPDCISLILDAPFLDCIILRNTDEYGNICEEEVILPPIPLPFVDAGEDQLIYIPHDGYPGGSALIELEATVLSDCDIVLVQWYDMSGMPLSNNNYLQINQEVGFECYSFYVYDIHGNIIVDEVCITVEEANSPPIAIADAYPDSIYIIPNDNDPFNNFSEIILVGTHSYDAEDDYLTFEWYNQFEEWLYNTPVVFWPQNIGTECYTLFVYDSYNVFDSDSICITVAYDFLMGDINYDYELNILDAVMLVNLVLDEEYIDIVDLNNDQIINILDIINLIDLIIE